MEELSVNRKSLDRNRLSKTQNVVLVAENNKNEYFMTKSKVKVTIGGCGG